MSHNARGAVVGVNDWAPDAPPGASGNGAWFESARGEGARGQANNPHHGGLVGVNTAGGVGVFGQSSGTAGYFDGNVEVTGDLVLVGADYAEAFMAAVEVEIEPGMIAIVDQDARLRPCDSHYDERVARIVSGARGTKPSTVIGRKDRAVPIATVGAAWRHSDAANSPIHPGTLLTTSSNPGHAIAANDRGRAFGAVFSKALTPSQPGGGYVRVLAVLAEGRRPCRASACP